MVALTTDRSVCTGEGLAYAIDFSLEETFVVFGVFVGCCAFACLWSAAMESDCFFLVILIQGKDVIFGQSG